MGQQERLQNLLEGITSDGVKSFLAWGLAAVVLAGAATSQGALSPEQVAQLPPPTDRPIVFKTDIQPILEASCISCHGRGRVKGGLKMETREQLLAGGHSGAAVVPGKSQESLLIELVSGLDPINIMPEKGTRLTADQVGLLRAWIDQGIPWPEEINFAKGPARNLVRREPALDPARLATEHPVDLLLEPHYAAHGVKPGAVVDDRTFARRTYLDVLGLLPPPAELERFLADPDPSKRARLVRELLGRNTAYAEHWLTFWNDLLRNDYRGTGYIDGGRKPITGWLYAALEKNLSYREFVAALVNPTPETEGFTKGIIWRGVVNASQKPEMQAAQNIAQVFMGVNIKCASCHDSFIDQWRLADAYGLAAVYSDGPLEMFECDKPTGQKADVAFLYPQLGTIDPKADKAARMLRLAQIITGPDDGRLPRTLVNRLWGRFFGHALVEPVDDMEQPAWNPDLLDWLAEDFARHGYDIKHLIARILTSKAYQLPAVDLGEKSKKEFAFRGPGIRRLSAEQFRDALGQLTGVWYGRAEFGGKTNAVRSSLVASDPLMTALGRPNREQVVTVRSSDATTLQALELTNGETLTRVVTEGATQVAQASTDPGQVVTDLYGKAFGRKPTETERELAGSLVGSPPQAAGVADLMWSLVMLPEFQLVY